WTTSGTGTFNNPEINSPVYYPSEQDIEDGYVTLTIAGTGSSTTITDDVMFTFEKSPVVNPGDDITICSNSSVLFENASADNYNEILWTSEGDGFFDDATQINSSYTPGVNDIEQGYVSLTLSATGGDLCGTISESIALTVLKAATAFAGADTDICPGVIYHITDASFSNYEEITWQTSGDGTFSDMNVANPTYTPGVSDKNSKEVTLSVAASNSTGCSDAQDEIMITILCTDIAELNNLASISIFPNPNNGSFTLNLSNIGNKDNVLSIFNSQGKIVHKESISQLDNTSEYKVDLNVPAGIYTIRLAGAGLNITKSFIKN
ncbi:MAG: T9SS type A sorting domain-containing protein, partial [Lentimicrobiaceae bacterium]|nr:T9SS type A sorting domain-containing protein [Lentimicrobiaceae bacterium]MBT5162211.1 T9SS type A sorting domain-containing protein [Lentimicrobiaceae bacterium]